jgi:hypothetical protein
MSSRIRLRSLALMFMYSPSAAYTLLLASASAFSLGGLRMEGCKKGKKTWNMSRIHEKLASSITTESSEPPRLCWWRGKRMCCILVVQRVKPLWRWRGCAMARRFTVRAVPAETDGHVWIPAAVPPTLVERDAVALREEALGLGETREVDGRPSVTHLGLEHLMRGGLISSDVHCAARPIVHALGALGALRPAPDNDLGHMFPVRTAHAGSDQAVYQGAVRGLVLRWGSRDHCRKEHHVNRAVAFGPQAFGECLIAMADEPEEDVAALSAYLHEMVG